MRNIKVSTSIMVTLVVVLVSLGITSAKHSSPPPGKNNSPPPSSSPASAPSSKSPPHHSLFKHSLFHRSPPRSLVSNSPPTHHSSHSHHGSHHAHHKTHKKSPHHAHHGVFGDTPQHQYGGAPTMAPTPSASHAKKSKKSKTGRSLLSNSPPAHHHSSHSSTHHGSHHAHHKSHAHTHATHHKVFGDTPQHQYGGAPTMAPTPSASTHTKKSKKTLTKRSLLPKIPQGKPGGGQKGAQPTFV